MDEYKGISMFKVSKEQHRRLLVSLWVVVVLTVIRNIVLPGLPGNAENAGLLLLLPVVKGKVFMFILGAAVVVAQCVILNELRVVLRRIPHWGQWACLVFMVALVSNFMLGSVFTWFGTDASFYFSTVSRVVSYLQIGSFFLLSGAWLVVACVLAFSFSGRIKDCLVNGLLRWQAYWGLSHSLFPCCSITIFTNALKLQKIPRNSMQRVMIG